MKVPLCHSAPWKPLKLFCSWRPLELLSTWDSIIHGVFLSTGYIYIYLYSEAMGTCLSLWPFPPVAGNIALTKIKSFKNQFKRTAFSLLTFSVNKHLAYLTLFYLYSLFHLHLLIYLLSFFRFILFFIF